VQLRCNRPSRCPKCVGGRSRDREQRQRAEDRHTDSSGYADVVYLHSPCTGR
jgi:hypothetical protein